MRRMIPFLAAFVAAALLAAPASAAILIQGLGMFGPTALTSKYTAPNQSFMFSFELPDDFAYSVPAPGAILTTQVQNLDYWLNGAKVATTLQYLAFTPQGFLFLFTDQVELYFAGADIGGSGMLKVPSAGQYQVLFDNALADVGSGYVVTSRMANPPPPASGAPEPAAWALLILGSAATGAALRGARRPQLAS